jgi:radical SAM protein with 4Fe4S-binding SPASM domain
MSYLRASSAYPKYVGIETINTCNARCPFCPLFQGEAMLSRQTRPAKFMDDALFDAIVGEVAKWSEVSSIFLNMNGEPLQDPNFMNRCAGLKRHGLGPKIELQTNAHFMTDNIARAILDSKIGRIVIGFDGATKETYEAHRVRCNFERTLGNIREFVRLRRELAAQTKIAVQFVRTGENQAEVADAWEMFSEILDPAIDVFQDDIAKDWGDIKGSDNYYFMNKRKQPSSEAGCQLFEDQLIINSDGKVQACCWDYNLSVSDGGLGDATVERLSDIWQSKKRDSIRAKINSPDPKKRPEKCQLCIFNGPLTDWPPTDARVPSEYVVNQSPFGLTYALKGFRKTTAENGPKQ